MNVVIACRLRKRGISVDLAQNFQFELSGENSPDLSSGHEDPFGTPNLIFLYQIWVALPGASDGFARAADRSNHVKALCLAVTIAATRWT